MCLAIPGKVVSIATDDSTGVKNGKVNFGGIEKNVCLEYVPETKIGDYVLVHVGFALSRIDEEEAMRTFQLLEDLNQLAELHDPPEVEGDKS